MVLLGSAESLGRPRRLMAPRLTSHVATAPNALDVPVLDDQAFVFRTGGHVGPRAHVEGIHGDPGGALRRADPVTSRADFSRWLNDVFRDPGWRDA
jgi:hypothetical protein